MKNLSLSVVVLTLIILSGCGASLNRTFNGSKSDQFGTSQITMIMSENGQSVVGTWTSNGGTTGFSESGQMTATRNGNILQNVSWISNSNMQNLNPACNTPLSGTIQVNNGGETLSGFLNSQATSVQGCGFTNKTLTLTLTAVN